MNRWGKFLRKESTFAYLLMLPAILLLIGLIGYPMVSNIILSFEKLPINPAKPPVFVGIDNYLEVLSDGEFYRSAGVTILYTVIVTFLSTIVGLLVAMLLNRPFKGKKLVNAIVICSYVIPTVSIAFCWKYMFNSIYGIVNYLVMYVFNLTDTVPLWFDNSASAFVLVCIFSIWKHFPYAYISFRAILQSIDNNLYEAAELDGANRWQRFLAVTYPSIKPVIVTVVSLRAIWTFYTYDIAKLLTSQVDLIGVYLYEKAFVFHDLGSAAAICILLFIIIFSLITLLRKKVFKYE